MEELSRYLMESPHEATRLDIKTDPEKVMQQAIWCGIGPGARVIDVGCGSGKGTSILHELVQPGGFVLGVDFSEERISYAREKFGSKEGIEFQIINFTGPLETLGQFDFVWLRFVLEYFLKEAPDIIRNLVPILRKDGVICLLDLDHNCLNHFPLPDHMESVLKQLIERMSTDYNFDPYAGRKLYTYLHDLGFRNIGVNMMAHHLIYDKLDSRDEFNWLKKIEMASKKAADVFEEYPGGYDGFFKDFNAFFNDPRRFTYTPLIICTGNKPEV